MTLPSWREEAIAKSHHRQSFDCRDPTKNDFFRRYARQSHKQNASKTFCAIDASAPNRVLGSTRSPPFPWHTQACRRRYVCAAAFRIFVFSSTAHSRGRVEDQLDGFGFTSALSGRNSRKGSFLACHAPAPLGRLFGCRSGMTDVVGDHVQLPVGSRYDGISPGSAN